jgi:hypothetical protein
VSFHDFGLCTLPLPDEPPRRRREADAHLKSTKKADKTVKKLFVKLKHYEDHKTHIEAYNGISSVRACLPACLRVCVRACVRRGRVVQLLQLQHYSGVCCSPAAPPLPPLLSLPIPFLFLLLRTTRPIALSCTDRLAGWLAVPTSYLLPAFSFFYPLSSICIFIFIFLQGEDSVSDDEFTTHTKLGKHHEDHGQTIAGIQSKIDSIKEDIAKWQGGAAAGREKLTALVPVRAAFTLLLHFVSGRNFCESQPLARYTYSPVLFECFF